MRLKSWNSHLIRTIVLFPTKFERFLKGGKGQVSKKLIPKLQFPSLSHSKLQFSTPKIANVPFKFCHRILLCISNLSRKHSTPTFDLGYDRKKQKNQEKICLYLLDCKRAEGESCFLWLMQGVNLMAGCICLGKSQRRTGPMIEHLQLWYSFISSKIQPCLRCRWGRKSTSPFHWEQYVSLLRNKPFRSVVINICVLYRNSRWPPKRAGRGEEFWGKLQKFPRCLGYVVRWICELWLWSLYWMLLGWMASGYSVYQFRQHYRK